LCAVKHLYRVFRPETGANQPLLSDGDLLLTLRQNLLEMLNNSADDMTRLFERRRYRLLCRGARVQRGRNSILDLIPVENQQAAATDQEKCDEEGDDCKCHFSLSKRPC